MNAPHGSCMVCGHDKPYGVWHESLVAGVCYDCRGAGQAVSQVREVPAATFHSSGNVERDWHAWDDTFTVSVKGDETAAIEGLAYALRYLLDGRKRRESRG